jgi:hypothetical protein
VSKPCPACAAAISLLQLPPSRRAPGEVASAYRSAIVAQQSFELLLLPAGGTSGGAVLQAQFRCAANTQLANGPPIGIPNVLPGDGSASATGGRSFYLASLRSSQPAQAAAPRSSMDDSKPNSAPLLQQGRDSERRRDSGGTTRPPPQRHASFNVLIGNTAFPDIKLGPLLGRGAFGRVYRGEQGACCHSALLLSLCSALLLPANPLTITTAAAPRPARRHRDAAAMWGGHVVAVKIIEYIQVVGQPGPLEGLLSEQVNNPHVVRWSGSSGGGVTHMLVLCAPGRVTRRQAHSPGAPPPPACWLPRHT